MTRTGDVEQPRPRLWCDGVSAHQIRESSECQRLPGSPPMRNAIVVSLLLATAPGILVAQRPDTTAAPSRDTVGTFPAAPAVAAPTPADARRARAAVRRDAELRRRRVDFLDDATLNPQAPFTGKSPQLWGSTLLTSGDEQTIYLLVRRTVSSVPEVHARWDDIVMVRAGNGAIELGDSLVGSHYRAPGERAGGTITQKHQIVVHAGDLVRIPAAVPHAFIVAGSTPLQYLVIKRRRQELPIRWFGDR